MGTAGHIDHGKTTLVKALTGFDCDTHKEEKLRGITINLGFTHIDYENDVSIGIVDVPGHKDFINTMAAGASGIDFTMLVIAADSGVMPQTIEHIKIMQLLGVKRGFVALTKIDLVDNDLKELAIEDIKENLKNTFLENCPIIEVSSKTGEGIEDLKFFLKEFALKTPEKEKKLIFRMFIDRIFTVQGFGTIVNGSVLSGKFKKGDSVYLLPSAKKLRIRRLEHHHQEVQEIVSGDRASLNPVNLDRSEFKRGMLLSDRILPVTTLIDVKLKLINKYYGLDLWSQVIFLSGTYQSQAKVHLIDKNHLNPNEECIAQIHLLSFPCALMHNDKFIIRNSSNDFTLGGGTIIDANPLHHRRRPQKLLKKLSSIASGKLSDLIAAEVYKNRSGINHKELAIRLNIEEDDILHEIQSNLPQDIEILSDKDLIILITKDTVKQLRKGILRILKQYHKRNPLDEMGKTSDELIGMLGLTDTKKSKDILKIILEIMSDENLIKKKNHTWILFDHNITLSLEDKKQINFINNFLVNSKLKTPLMSELIAKSEKKGIGENKLKQILRLLVNRKQIYNIDGNFIHSKIVDRYRLELLNYLSKNPEKGVRVADFRDLISGNRKICLLLLSRYDKEGITVRKGDYRYITRKGFEFLEKNEQS